MTLSVWCERDENICLISLFKLSALPQNLISRIGPLSEQDISTQNN